MPVVVTAIAVDEVTLTVQPLVVDPGVPTSAAADEPQILVSQWVAACNVITALEQTPSLVTLEVR